MHGDMFSFLLTIKFKVFVRNLETTIVSTSYKTLDNYKENEKKSNITKLETDWDYCKKARNITNTQLST